jgi:hypothetical protein
VKVLVVLGIVAIVSAGIGLASGAIVAAILGQPRRYLWIGALLGILGFLIPYLALYQISPRMNFYGPFSAGLLAAIGLPAIHQVAMKLMRSPNS